MILTAKIAFEEIGTCHIARFVVKNLFDNLTASKIAEITKLPLTTVNYYRKQKHCIGENKKITGYVYINFNHLIYVNRLFPEFNINHYCILSMLQSHKFDITDSYIRQKLNLPDNTNLIEDTKAFQIDWKETAKKAKGIKIIL